MLSFVPKHREFFIIDVGHIPQSLIPLSHIPLSHFVTAPLAEPGGQLMVLARGQLYDPN